MTFPADSFEQVHWFQEAGGLSILDVLFQHRIEIASSCGGKGTCGLCKVKIGIQSANSLTPAEKNSLSQEEIHQGFRLACQCYPDHDMEVCLSDARHRYQFRTVWETDSPFEGPVYSGETRHAEKSGLCIDMGTTLIRFSLLDLNRKKRLVEFTCPNPQMRFGSDILTRLIHGAGSDSHACLLSDLLCETISKGVDFINRDHHRRSATMDRVMVVGNTAILSLFTQKNHKELLSPSSWVKEIDCQPDNPLSLKSRCGLSPRVSLEIVPPIKGFVGSDLLSAMVSSQIIHQFKRALLVDFGTNTEIGLWNENTLWITSAAGGPAFDGCGISCGMPAEPGAVYAVEPGFKGEPSSLKTIGNLPARGICGSGLLAVIAEFVKSGKIKKSGNFIIPKPILLKGDGRTIRITKKDVDTFQRAKAAVGAGIACLLEESGTWVQEIEQLIICGSFGQHIDIEKAQFIGLLPGIPLDQCRTMGNAALEGCERLMLSLDGKNQIDQVKKRCKLVDLGGNADFETVYPCHLSLDSFERNAYGKGTRHV